MNTHITCPECGAGTRVIDSRLAGFDRGTIRRRRQCTAGHRFTTHEYVHTAEEDRIRKVIDGIKSLPKQQQEILFAFVNTFTALVEPQQIELKPQPEQGQASQAAA